MSVLVVILLFIVVGLSIHGQDPIWRGLYTLHRNRLHRSTHCDNDINTKREYHTHANDSVGSGSEEKRNCAFRTGSEITPRLLRLIAVLVSDSDNDFASSFVAHQTFERIDGLLEFVL